VPAGTVNTCWNVVIVTRVLSPAQFNDTDLGRLSKYRNPFTRELATQTPARGPLLHGSNALLEEAETAREKPEEYVVPIFTWCSAFIGVRRDRERVAVTR
jgi:hypothetical protein